MSERGSGLNRLRLMWIMLGTFLVTAVGATLVVLFLDPDRQDSALNEWVILAVMVVAAAAGLGLLHGKWFTRIPDNAAVGVTGGMFVRVAVAEVVWIVTTLFYVFGVVGNAVLIASIGAAIALTLAFAAPTSRLVGHLQYQLDSLGAAVDLSSELRLPIS